MKKLLILFMLFATPAFAQYKTGFGVSGGVLEGEPAAYMNLEIEEPRSQIHGRVSVGSWKPENLNGVFDVTLSGYYHFSPCWQNSFYVGGGIGTEWIVPEAVSPPPSQCCIETPPPPPPPDPPSPIALVFGGVRFPGDRVDGFLEGRHYMGVGGRERSGVFVGVGFHPTRKKHKH